MGSREQQANDPIGCNCDEFPECTHALYFYMGAKHAGAANAAAQPDTLRERLEGFSDITVRDDALEEAAKVVDECNREGPYNAIGAAERRQIE
jgi:hypothetical protein